jgi:DHA1 family bicyclomycin/chloramphenicol resistance-like MFS transporter
MTESSQKTPWGLVVLLGALTAMGPLAIDMYLPSLPAMAADLRASATEAQSTMAAFLAGMALGQPLYGPASDRFGRKPPLLLGCAIFVAGSAGCALADTAPLLIAMRFLQALGACSGGVVARAVVRDRFEHTETARMLSLMMLIMGLAPILAPLLGGALLGLGGWRALFWAMTAFGVALTVAALPRLAESRSAETAAQARSEHPIRAYLSLLGQKRLVGYALAGALNGACLFTYISSSPALLIDDYRIPPVAFGWVFGLNAAGVIGANQLNRRLLRRWTPDEVLARSSFVAVGAAAMLLAAAVSGVGGRWSVLPLLFLVLGSYGLMQGNTMAGALSLDPRRAGSISALLGSASFAAGALAAWSVGMLRKGAAAPPMALVMFVALAGSAIALWTLALPKGLDVKSPHGAGERSPAG